MFTGMVHSPTTAPDPSKEFLFDPDQTPGVDSTLSLQKIDPSILLTSTLHDIVALSRKAFIRSAADSIRKMRETAPDSEALTLFRTLVGNLSTVLDDLLARTPRFEDRERAYQLFVKSDDPHRQLSYAKQLVQEYRARHEQVEIACHVYKGKLERRDKVIDYIRETLLAENVRLQEQVRLRNAGEYFEDEVLNVFDFAPILEIIKETAIADEPLEAVFATDPNEVHRMVTQMRRDHEAEKSQLEAERDAQDVALFNKERELDEVLVDLANLRKSFAVEYANLKQEMAAARVEAVDTLQRQISSQAAEFRQIRIDLEKELRSANLEVTRLQDLLGSQAADQERYERDVARLDAQLRTAQRRIDADRESHGNELREVNERHRQEIEKQRLRNEQELERLRLSYDGAARAVELRLQADMEDLSAELVESRAGHLAQSVLIQAQHQQQLRAAQDHAKGDLQVAAATLDEVHKGLNREHGNLTRKTEELRMELKLAQESKAQVQSRLFASEMRLTAAERELESLQKTRGKQKEARVKAEQLAAESQAALVEEKAALTARIDGLTNRVAELEEMLQLESQTFQQRETQQRSLLREYEGRVTKLASSNEALRVELETLQKVANEESSEMFQSAYAQVQERLQRKQEELIDLQNELSGAAQTLRQFSMNLLGGTGPSNRRNTQSAAAEEQRKRTASLRSLGPSSSIGDRRATVAARSKDRSSRRGRDRELVPSLPNSVPGSPSIGAMNAAAPQPPNAAILRRASRRKPERRKESVKSDGTKSIVAQSSASSRTNPQESAAGRKASGGAGMARSSKDSKDESLPRPTDDPVQVVEVSREGVTGDLGVPGSANRRGSAVSVSSGLRGFVDKVMSTQSPKETAHLAVAAERDRRGSTQSNVTTATQWVSKMDKFRFGEDDDVKLTRQKTEHNMNAAATDVDAAARRAMVAQKFTKLVHGGDDMDSLDESELLREDDTTDGGTHPGDPSAGGAAAREVQEGGEVNDEVPGISIEVPDLSAFPTLVSEAGATDNMARRSTFRQQGQDVGVQCNVSPGGDKRTRLFRSASMRGGSEDPADDESAGELSTASSFVAKPNATRSGARTRRLLWTCPAFDCGRGLLDGRFCSQCATARPLDASPSFADGLTSGSSDTVTAVAAAPPLMRDVTSTTPRVGDVGSAPRSGASDAVAAVASAPLLPQIPRRDMSMSRNDLPTVRSLPNGSTNVGESLISRFANPSSPRKSSRAAPLLGASKRGLQSLDLDTALPVVLTTEFYTAFTQTDDAYMRVQKELAHTRRQLLARTMELETLLATAEANPEATATAVVREFVEGAVGKGVLLALPPIGLADSELGIAAAAAPPPLPEVTTPTPRHEGAGSNGLLDAMGPARERAAETAGRMRADNIMAESALRDAIRLRKMEVIKQLAASPDGFHDGRGRLVMVDDNANIIRALRQQDEDFDEAVLDEGNASPLAGWAPQPIRHETPDALAVAGGSKAARSPAASAAASQHTMGLSMDPSDVPASHIPEPASSPAAARAARARRTSSGARGSGASRGHKRWEALRNTVRSGDVSEMGSKRRTGSAGASLAVPQNKGLRLRSGESDRVSAVGSQLSADAAADVATPAARATSVPSADAETPRAGTSRARRQVNKVEELSSRLHEMVVRNNHLLETIRQQSAMLRQAQNELAANGNSAAAAAAADQLEEVLRVADDVMNGASTALAVAVADTDDRPQRKRSPRGVSFGADSVQEAPLWVLKLKELEARVLADETLEDADRERAESAGKFVRLYEVAARRLSTQFEELAVQGGLMVADALGGSELRPSTSHTAGSHDGTVVAHLPRRSSDPVRSRSGSRAALPDAPAAAAHGASSNKLGRPAPHSLLSALAGAESLALGSSSPFGATGAASLATARVALAGSPIMPRSGKHYDVVSVLRGDPLSTAAAARHSDDHIGSPIKSSVVGALSPLSSTVHRELPTGEAALAAELSAALRREAAATSELSILRKRVAALGAASLDPNPSRLTAETAAYLAHVGPTGAAFAAGLPTGHLPFVPGAASAALDAAQRLIEEQAAAVAAGTAERDDVSAAAMLGAWEHTVAAWSQRDALAATPAAARQVGGVGLFGPEGSASEEVDPALTRRSDMASALRQAAVLATGAATAVGYDDVSGAAINEFITQRAVGMSSGTLRNSTSGSADGIAPGPQWPSPHASLDAGSVGTAGLARLGTAKKSAPSTEAPAPTPRGEAEGGDHLVDVDELGVGSVASPKSQLAPSSSGLHYVRPSHALVKLPAPLPASAPVAAVVAYDVEMLAYSLQSNGGIGTRQLQSLVSHADLLRRMSVHSGVDVPAAVFPSLAKMLYAVLSPQQMALIPEASALGAALREAVANDIQRHVVSFITHNAAGDTALATALSVAVSGKAVATLDGATATIVGSAVAAAVADVLRAHSSSPVSAQIANAAVAALSTFYGIARQGTSNTSDAPSPYSRPSSHAARYGFGPSKAPHRPASRATRPATKLGGGGVGGGDGGYVHPLSSAALGGGDVWSSLGEGVQQHRVSLPPTQPDGSAYPYFPSECPVPYCPCPCHFPSAESDDESDLGKDPASADPAVVKAHRAARRRRKAAKAASNWSMAAGPLGLGPLLDHTIGAPTVSPVEAVVRAWARALALRGRTLWHRGGGFSGFSRQLIDTFYAAGHLPQDAIVAWPKNVSKKWTPEALAKSTLTITSYVPSPGDAADGPAVAAALALSAGTARPKSTRGIKGAGSAALPSRSPVTVGGAYAPVLSVLAAAAAAMRDAQQTAADSTANMTTAALVGPRAIPPAKLLAQLTGATFPSDILAANGTIVTHGVSGQHPNHSVELPGWPVQGSPAAVIRGVSHSKPPPPRPPPGKGSAHAVSLADVVVTQVGPPADAAAAPDPLGGAPKPDPQPARATSAAATPGPLIDVPEDAPKRLLPPVRSPAAQASTGRTLAPPLVVSAGAPSHSGTPPMSAPPAPHAGQPTASPSAGRLAANPMAAPRAPTQPVGAFSPRTAPANAARAGAPPAAAGLQATNSSNPLAIGKASVGRAAGGRIRG